jgi:hypothetical protein
MRKRRSRRREDMARVYMSGTADRRSGLPAGRFPRIPLIESAEREQVLDSRRPAVRLGAKWRKHDGDHRELHSHAAAGQRHRERRCHGAQAQQALRRGRYRRRRAARRRHRHHARQAHRRDGAVGLGQVDDDAHPRRSRPADRWYRDRRRHRDHGAQGARADDAPPREDRLHLSDVQPAADAQRGGERGAAAGDR